MKRTIDLSNNARRASNTISSVMNPPIQLGKRRLGIHLKLHSHKQDGDLNMEPHLGPTSTFIKSFLRKALKDQL